MIYKILISDFNPEDLKGGWLMDFSDFGLGDRWVDWSDIRSDID